MLFTKTVWNYAVKLITIVAIAMGNFSIVLPAVAVTQNFQLQSDRGYRVETVFDYSDRLPEKITERGKGITDRVDFLKVRFYNPAGEMIASYDNVLAAVARGNYFEFNFDPQTQQPFGNLDLGGETAAEMYLKGNVAEGFDLIEVDSSGEEIVVDSGHWTLSTD